jgi:hypothetical protein
MRSLIAGALLITLGVVSMLSGEARVHAATTTPTPTPVPTRATTITVRHMLNGVPVIATLDHRINFAQVNGVTCASGTSTDVQSVLAITSLVRWPFGNQSECYRSGVPMSVCPVPSICSEQFVFEGHDAKVNLDWDFGKAPIATAHFRRDGSPVAVTIISAKWESDGKTCFSEAWPGFYGDTPQSTVSDLANPFVTAGCPVVGESIGASFNTVEFGELQASFGSHYQDVDYDVVIPGGEMTSSSPTATVTPASLPEAGGSPRASEMNAALVAIAGGFALTGAGWWIARKRSG